MLCFLLFLGCLLSTTATQAEYLREETLSLPMDGGNIATSRLLDPSRQYAVTLRSTYNLRPLLAPEYCKEFPRFLNSSLVLCYPPLFFDRSTLDAATEQRIDRGSYFLYDKYPHFYVNKLDFFFWGTGRKFVLKAVDDLSLQIPVVNVEIRDIVHAKEEQNRQQAEQLLKQQEIEAARRRRIEEERRLEALRLDREQQEQERQARLEQERLRKQEIEHAERLNKFQQEREHARQETLRQLQSPLLAAAGVL